VPPVEPPATSPPATGQTSSSQEAQSTAAQASPAPAPTPTSPPGEAQPTTPVARPSGERSFGEEIVVTGSRIRRKDLTTPAPVTIIDREQILASGKVSIGAFLQTLPEQGNAINTAVNNGGDGSTRINLRSIGESRTLVLLNGRRMVPGGTGANVSVDLDSIPTAAVERIEVLKDGASAVYGSDAIAGVVNVITRRKFDGTEATAYAGTSAHGDATLYDVSATTGMSGARGSILFSAGFSKQEPIFAGDRAFSARPLGYDAAAGQYAWGSGFAPAGSFALPESQVGQPVANPSSDPRRDLYNQLVTTYPDAQMFVRDPSSPLGWRPFVFTLPTDDPPGDAYNFMSRNYLVTPQQRISLFSTGDFSLGDRARAYFEASYVNRQSEQRSAPEPLLFVPVSAQSQYNPFNVDISAGRRLVEFGDRVFSQDIDTFRIVTGVDGTLPGTAGPLEDWFWDVSFNYGRTQSSELRAGSLSMPRLQAALGPSAGGQCLDAGGNVVAGCVPLDLFSGPGSITPEQVAGLAFTGVERGTNQLLAVQVNTSGELFRLFADRPIGLALGYEYRNLRGSFIPDPITAAGETTGNAIQSTAGGYHVNEGYAELSIPVVSRLPFAESVEATAAVRAFRYSTFGGDWTYKLGGRWSVFQDLTIRGTYSTAFRAPSISDLFLGLADNYPSVSDPCADAATAPSSCPAAAVGNGDTRKQLLSRLGGNPLLRPEKANIYTMGVVLEPRWVKNLTVTVDYYKIDIREAISSIGEATILNGCYPSSGSPSEAYCALIARDPVTQQITTIDNVAANVGKESVSGIDIALRYAVPTRRYGRFDLSFDGTWLKHHDLLLADGQVISGRGNFDLNGTDGNVAGIGGVNPAWKFNAGLQWALSGLAASVNTRFVGSFKECGDSLGDFSGLGQCFVDSTYKREIDAYVQWDASLGYTFATGAGTTTLAAGVNNVFDASPPLIYNAGAPASDPTGYDFVGRFFYGRVTHRL
jgi:outer membrane receptor protein involved in Fe transport